MTDLSPRTFPDVPGKVMTEFRNAASAHGYERDSVVAWSIANTWRIITEGPFTWKRRRLGFIPTSSPVIPFRVTGDEPQTVTILMPSDILRTLGNIQRAYGVTSLSDALAFAASIAPYMGQPGHLTNGRTAPIALR